MADDDDDYLSSKFLVNTVPAPPTGTYAERRRQTQRASQLKHEQNRKKSQRQLEEESRKEGLSKSLFTRAEEQDASFATSNNALSIMMKMGFKPGQALGRVETPNDNDLESSDATVASSSTQHRVEPVPVQMWQGRKGVGLGKRAVSPNVSERIAKMARIEESANHEAYRSKARDDYEERRADGRLVSARRTCATLDEKAGKSFNLLCLDPRDAESFPPGLLDALEIDTAHLSMPTSDTEVGQRARLRKQMRVDALQPLAELDDEPPALPHPPPVFSPETIEETRQYLRMSARGRLAALLDYLRERHNYCFWCGTQYDSAEEMAQLCPGTEEDAHD